jgi:3-oxoadipate enol-lactonase
LPYLEKENIKIYYKIIGEGPPVVLIPGLAANYRNWGIQLASLKRHYTLIAIDNRGIGNSDGDITKLTIGVMVEDVYSVIESLKINNVNILGHSMGSMIAFEFALKYPKRVTSLILTSLPICKTKLGAIDPSLELCSFLNDNKKANFADKMVKYLFSNHFMNSDKFEAFKGLVTNNKERYRNDTIKAQLIAINEWKRLRRWENNINNLPYMVVYGSEDKFASVDNKFLSELFPIASIKIFNDAGHAVHIEKANDFNKIIHQFFKEKNQS